MKRVNTLFLLFTVASFATAATPPRQWQYKSGEIEIPAASPGEPVVEFGHASVAAAVKYLDDGALAWTRERSCIACHTTGVYMAERPALAKLLGSPQAEVHADFVKQVPAGDPVAKVQNGKQRFAGGVVFSIWRSLGLAQWDKHITGTLSESTNRSLRDTLLRQADNGLWPTVNKVEIPHTTTEFELGVQVARAIKAAPGWLDHLTDVDLRHRVDRLRKALRDHQPRNDYERALQLQLATVMPELVTERQRYEAVDMLWRLQGDDGGWSTRDMSDIDNWSEKMTASTRRLLKGYADAGSPESDPYMTAFAIVLLRQSGVAVEDKRIQAGVAWLKSQQRASGRWWMKSLYKDTHHFTTYIATAQALKALALCGEVPSSVDDDAAALAKRVVQSAGGESKLLKRFRMKERFNSGAERKSPGKTRTSILDPPDHWWIGNKERGTEPGKVTTWAWTLGVLTHPDSRIELLPDVAEGEVPLSGLRITATVKPPLDMYFDKDTHKLVRIDWRKDIYLFSEWKDFEGTRYPATSVMLRRGTRKPWFHHEILELERLEELPSELQHTETKPGGPAEN